MRSIFENKEFAAAYDRLANVKLNPRRHTASNAKVHSDEAAAVVVALGQANSCTDDEITLLRQLGHAHDIGKITGTARPQASVELLKKIGITDESFLALVKWHDISLPWYRSATKGQKPSDKAWRRLATEVDLRLLCMFMVADRADAPPGWRRNKPTTWFLNDARQRRYISEELVFDLDHRPSEICAGGAVVRMSSCIPEVLVIRVRSKAFELPKGGLEWDELKKNAALRETREETGICGPLEICGPLGEIHYRVENKEGGNHIKRVCYFRLVANGNTKLGPIPSRTLECRWVSEADLGMLPLVNEDLRLILRNALQEGD